MEGTARQFEKRALQNPKALSCHPGPTLEELEFEKQIKEWVLDQRKMDIPVSTKDIINHVIQVNQGFKKAGQQKDSWFMDLQISFVAWLSICKATHVGQKLSSYLKKVKEDCASAMRNRMSVRGTLHGMDLKYFINMDRTAVYFESKSSNTVNKVGAQTVSIHKSGSNSKSATIILAVAADGTKLPLFVVFKGKYHSVYVLNNNIYLNLIIANCFYLYSTRDCQGNH
jgi:hypothetical protein